MTESLRCARCGGTPTIPAGCCVGDELCAFCLTLAELAEAFNGVWEPVPGEVGASAA